MEIATLFESENFDKEERIIPYKELYPLVKEYFRKFCDKEKIEYDGDKEITFNKTKIIFYLNYSYKIKKYFLCILPANMWTYPTKEVLLIAFNETIEFFKNCHPQ